MDKLTEGLDRCQCALIVVSEASMASPWVKSEMTTLLSHAVAQKKRVIGVRLGDAPIPTMLANYQWIDFRKGDPTGDVFRSLVDALQGRRPRSPPRTDDFHTL